MLFEQVWVHFGITRSIILNRYTIFISSFWATHWEKMDEKLNISTTFHTSSSKSPFETYFGYCPPFLLDFVYEKQLLVREDTIRESLKVEKNH